MDLNQLEKLNDTTWQVNPHGAMHVPAVFYASESLVKNMDEKVYEQACNVAMPDAHWGYGFPIGGVAAFDPAQGGVISAGGVGFDISCGVRTLLTGLTRQQVEDVKTQLADALYHTIPAGLGSTGSISLNDKG